MMTVRLCAMVMEHSHHGFFLVVEGGSFQQGARDLSKVGDSGSTSKEKDSKLR